jgi:class 3 adenylate cyclase
MNFLLFTIQKFLSKVKNLFLLLVLSLSFHCAKIPISKAQSIQGSLNLESLDLQQTSVYLDGEWEFYPKQFIDPKEKNTTDNYIMVPSSWNEKLGTNYGYASFKLTLYLPENIQFPLQFRIPEQGTSYTLFINGETLAQNGKVAKEAKDSNPEFFPILSSSFKAEKKIELILHISNFEHREGGFWYSILLGSEKNIQTFRENSLLLDIFLCGSILIMGLYHIGLYLIRKKDFAPLFFGIFCISILFRLLSQNEKYIIYIFPEISFQALNKMEYISYYLAVPSFTSFLYSTFPYEFNKRIIQFIWIFSILFCLIVLFTVSNFYTEIVHIYHIFTLFNIIIDSFILVKAIIHKRHSVLMLAFGTFILILGTLNDILHSLEIIHTHYIVQHSLLFFIFIQSIVLSIRFSRAFHENEILITEMVQFNKVNKRFLPVKFINNLGKRNFHEVRLGDQIQKEMTILFSDIRDFTSISEKMTPAENFKFINEYLTLMGPLVRKEGGYIDKYIGDAIMALYDSPDQAILSAIQMQKTLHLYNQNSNIQIHVGIGIHTGSLMMGVIGEEERWEGTVISDSVNIASRIENLTKVYKSKILISENSLLKLNKDHKLNYMKIDIVQLKGKVETFAIYEILDGLPNQELELVFKIKLAFEMGVDCFHNKEYLEAKQLFEKVIQIYPEHKTTNLYLNRCEIQLKII